MTSKEEFEQLRQQRSQIASVQQRAAANPVKSVWVEASAGTGKTKVLSDRVLRLLLNGVSPNRLLCLTYTKAAAVEMNTRISERLSQWSIMAENKLEKELYALLGDEIRSSSELQRYKQTARTLFAILLDTPGGVKIQTIHSFCQEILKRFPLEAGVSPYFEVLDDNTAAEALEQIQKSMLENAEHSTGGSVKEALQYLTKNVSEFTFPKVMKTITVNRAKLGKMLRQYGGNQAYNNVLAQKLGINPQQTQEDLLKEFMQETDIEKRRSDAAALRRGKKNDNKKADKLEAMLQNGFRPEDYPDYRQIYLNKDGSAPEKIASKDALAADAGLESRMREEIERLQEFADKCCKARLYASTSAVLTIAGELTEEYNAFKRQTASLDYEDLIILTRDLLANASVASWVLFKLDGGLEHILIDEAQDTSPNQWDIIKSLSSEFFAGKGVGEKKRTVFAVGDRKQSIYSFQGADPEKFDTMSEYFSSAAADFEKINLSVSFRSSAAVLDTVNQLFAKPEVSKGVVAPDEKVQHIPYRAGEFGKVEIWPPLIADKKTKEEEAWLPPVEMSREVSVKTKMAQAIARKIQQMVTESRKTAKPLRYSDFMVLVQKRKNFVDEFIRACKDIGVNINGADKLRLSDQIAVQDLISLGKFLLLPNDDLSLAEVLKSPLFGLTDDDLMTLCCNRGKAPLWSKLGDNPKYRETYRQLQSLFEMLDYIRPYELYNYVLTKMNGRYKYTERMGIEVEDSLDEFINLTLDYEKEHIPTLQGFIGWISRSTVDIKRETEQKDSDAVRLMTVHGSKGLQAPIVFLPDTVRVKRVKSEQALLWDGDIAYYPLNKSCYDATCERIKKRNEDKSFEEYRRLLYVALTRAEDRLFICGSSNNEKIDEQSWYSLCQKCLQENGVPEDDILINEVPEVIEKKSGKKRNEETKEMPQPESWMAEEIEQESPLAKPYTPSKPEDEEEADSSSPLAEDGDFYRRGTLIHRLLQFLPQASEEQENVIDEFLRKNAADFSPAQQFQIKKEVLALLKNPEFSDIFGCCSQAEVPVIGEVGGKIISAQIDRLVLLPHKIMIVDFKTNRPAARTLEQVPVAYISQLNNYAELLKRIYPQKDVESYILWTNEARLMRVG